MNNSFAPPGESSTDLYNERTIIDGLFLGAVAYGEFQPVSSRRGLIVLSISWRRSSHSVHLVLPLIPLEKKISIGIPSHDLCYPLVHHGQYWQWDQHQGRGIDIRRQQGC